ETASTGMDRVPAVLCRPSGRRSDAARRHGHLVGAGHHRARHLVGRRSAHAPAARARGRAAAALFGDAWRHRCLQRQDDRAAEAMVLYCGMGIQVIVVAAALCVACQGSQQQEPQPPAKLAGVRVVDLVPLSLSGETWQDAEPFLALYDSNPKLMAASAFTPN